MLQTPRICVQNYQVRDIDETLKVMFEGKGYWIKIKESYVCHDIRDLQLQDTQQYDDKPEKLYSQKNRDKQDAKENEE